MLARHVGKIAMLASQSPYLAATAISCKKSGGPQQKEAYVEQLLACALFNTWSAASAGWQRLPYLKHASACAQHRTVEGQAKKLDVCFARSKKSVLAWAALTLSDFPDCRRNACALFLRGRRVLPTTIFGSILLSTCIGAVANSSHVSSMDKDHMRGRQRAHSWPYACGFGLLGASVAQGHRGQAPGACRGVWASSSSDGDALCGAKIREGKRLSQRHVQLWG